MRTGIRSAPPGSLRARPSQSGSTAPPAPSRPAAARRETSTSSAITGNGENLQHRALVRTARGGTAPRDEQLTVRDSGADALHGLRQRRQSRPGVRSGIVGVDLVVHAVLGAVLSADDDEHPHDGGAGHAAASGRQGSRGVTAGRGRVVHLVHGQVIGASGRDVQFAVQDRSGRMIPGVGIGAALLHVSVVAGS
jgi:hypothetical protein